MGSRATGKVAFATNLPTQVTSFIGRDREIAEVMSRSYAGRERARGAGDWTRTDDLRMESLGLLPQKCSVPTTMSLTVVSKHSCSGITTILL